MTGSPEPRTTREVAETYFAAWQARDADTLRSLFADDVTFDGPLASLRGADACVAGLVGMGAILEGLDVRLRLVDGPDVVTWFDLRTTVAEPAPTANWTHVEDGLVTAVRVAFDPRGVLAAG
ncbi:nuclear transport factor 2 family protein [Nocardioides sp. CFH 31398]|jgi:hypothetical protein|uniref:nuclear transport factor 2 family protein n=1 Tax=Nocardioides sp. CFH 31398 TaxID=2919579 RepID=UPI001F0626C4|nr:nuclear transport factor 2 family protein [Nocardioides sp. CFH 31398]MCH1866162.1 nuclear transport factor 2 family protein [Nocardioides sp. CFH 31398]